ncbi:hypothetical protein HGM15179_015732 [Zosterops borbonicus]|uniref:Uncharacterized protein n=1 Tax=Zosterops borbonicus TaxID=364589 RepID=A0A8K1LEW5_9PASS|nr:hypothetical protein HGM15179_015732 [Zosterops borbonicus]
MEKALGVLLTAAGHKPRGAQVAKKANGPWAVPAMVWQQEQGSDCPCAGTAEGPPPILGADLGPSQQGIEGLEHVQRREPSWGRGWRSRRELRELGKGLSLEKRRLRRDLLALHNSLTGGDSRGGSGSALQEQRQDKEMASS